MLPDRVSNPGPLTYESGVLLTALRDPARLSYIHFEKLSNSTNLVWPPLRVCKNFNYKAEFLVLIL